jgi:hypothetical protein
MQAVSILEGPYEIGDILKTKVLAADKNSLKGGSIQLLAGANN